MSNVFVEFFPSGSFNAPQDEIERIRTAPNLVFPVTGDFEDFDADADDVISGQVPPLMNVVYRLDSSGPQTLYIVGDGYQDYVTSLGGYMFELLVSNVVVHQLARDLNSGDYFFDLVQTGTSRVDQQLIDTYEISDQIQVPEYFELNLQLPGARIEDGAISGEPAFEYFDEYYLSFSGNPVVSTFGVLPENSRYLITTSNEDLIGQREDNWDPDWFERIAAGLFTPLDDIVDLNQLDEADKQYLDNSFDLTLDLYDAQNGLDRVILPDAANNQLTETVIYDPSQIFRAGAGNDFIFGGDQGDQIVGQQGNDTLSGAGGDDKLYGSDPLSFGFDFIDSSTDMLFGDEGDDDLFGSGGNDELAGGADSDDLFGGRGNDILYGGSHSQPDDGALDRLAGGLGNDRIFFDGRDEILFSGNGTDYVVELSVAPFIGAEISGPDGTDTLFGSDPDAQLAFENVNVTFTELVSVVADQAKIAALSDELTDQLERLIRKTETLERIDALIEKAEEGIEEADVEQVVGLMQDILLAIPVFESASLLPGLTRSDTLVKQAADTTLDFIKTNENALSVGEIGAKLAISDQSVDDAALAGLALVATLAFSGPLAIGLGIAIGLAGAANNYLKMQQQIDTMKAQLLAYRDTLETFEIQADAVTKIVTGLAQNLMDATGQDQGWPCARLPGDDTDCGRSLLEAVEEVTGGFETSGLNLVPEDSYAGTGDDDTVTDMVGAASVATGGGADSFSALTDTGDIDLGEGDDVATLLGGFSSIDGGAGDNDQLKLVRFSEGLGSIFPESANVAGFESVAVVLDGEDIPVELRLGHAGTDVIEGSEQTDLIVGAAGDDTLGGAGGNDFVEGGSGDDTLSGGTGNDRLVGGLGNDTMTGGGGLDLFVAQANGGQDTITDFEDGLDLLDLRLFDRNAALTAINNAQAGSVILSFIDGTTITLQGIDLADFSLEDVLLGNAAPTDIVATPSAAVEENSQAGTVITTLATVDADAGDIHTYAINYAQSDPDAAFFEIVDDRLQVAPGAMLDYESRSQYRLVVETDDGNGGVFVKDLDVSIIDVPGGTITGTPNADTLVGSPEDDTIIALAEDDAIDGLGGSDTIDGGSGHDTVTYEAPRAQFEQKLMPDGTITITKPGGETDTLIAIERIDFVDGDYVYDIDSGNADFGYLIYQASFGRVPDEGGVRFWINVLDALDDQGWDALEKQQFLAGEFIGSDEFQALYGDNPTNFEYIDAMYVNVLNRLPDQAGYDFWVGGMEQGLTREDILIAFTNSVENVERNSVNLDDGIWVV